MGRRRRPAASPLRGAHLQNHGPGGIGGRPPLGDGKLGPDRSPVGRGKRPLPAIRHPSDAAQRGGFRRRRQDPGERRPRRRPSPVAGRRWRSHRRLEGAPHGNYPDRRIPLGPVAGERRHRQDRSSLGPGDPGRIADPCPTSKPRPRRGICPRRADRAVGRRRRLSVPLGPGDWIHRTLASRPPGHGLGGRLLARRAFRLERRFGRVDPRLAPGDRRSHRHPRRG